MERKTPRRILLLAAPFLFSALLVAQKAPPPAPKPADRAAVEAIGQKALEEEKKNRFAEAEALFKEAIKTAEARGGKDGILFVQAQSALAEYYVRRGMYLEAADLLDLPISLREKGKAPVLPPQIIIVDLALYGVSLYGIGDEEGAEFYLKKASKLARDLLRTERRPYRGELRPVTLALVRAERGLIRLLEGQGRTDEAGVIKVGIEEFMKNLEFLP